MWTGVGGGDCCVFHAFPSEFVVLCSIEKKPQVSILLLDGVEFTKEVHMLPVPLLGGLVCIVCGLFQGGKRIFSSPCCFCTMNSQKLSILYNMIDYGYINI